MRSKQTGKETAVEQAKTSDSYLASLSVEQRAALEKLRAAIKAAVPNAEECMSYGRPAFRLHGKFLVAYGAFRNDCAFYPGAAVQSFGKELKGYDVGKGTIRFPSDRPLPAALVKKLVKLQVARKGLNKK